MIFAKFCSIQICTQSISQARIFNLFVIKQSGGLLAWSIFTIAARSRASKKINRREYKFHIYDMGQCRRIVTSASANKTMSGLSISSFHVEHRVARVSTSTRMGYGVPKHPHTLK